MANENQEQLKNLQETADSLRVAQQNLAANQQPVNEGFKASVNLLNKMNNLISDSASKTASFEKTTINLKRIQTEQERIERRRLTLAEQINQANQTDKATAEAYITNIEQRKKLEEDIIKKRSVGNYQQASALSNQLIALENTIKAQEQGLQQEQLSLITKIQSEKALSERVENIKKELDEERKIQKEVGKTGTILKLLNKYLLVGKDTYAKMVEEARNGDKSTKQWVAKVAILSAAVYGAYKGFSAFAGIAKTGLDSLTGTGGPISKFAAPFTDLVKQIPLIGGLLGGLIEGFVNLLDFATGATAKVEEFGRNLGISYDQAKKINNEFASFSINSGKAFLSVEKLQNSQLELSKSLGINNILNNQILADNIQLQEQAGLELDTRKELAQIALISDKRQTQIFKTVVGQVEAIRRSVGVNLRVQDVISNISKLSGVVGLTFAKYPEKLAKSLAVTKALGLDFQKLDGIASGLLDFESSIASEFEAQLITGKDINLAKARQLALDNDLTGLAVELNKQLGSSNDFLNMNRIAQESYAKALGMSRDEIADMLRQQEFFAAAGATDLKTFKERVAQMERAGTLQSEFLNKLSEEQAQYYLSSTATEKIANFVDKIRQSFAQLLSSDQFKSFIDSFINKLSDPNFLTGIINKLTSFVSLMIKAVGALLQGLDMLPFVEIDRSVIDSIYGIANNIGSISVGGKVASSQVSSGGGNLTPQPAAASSSPNLQAINLTVQAVVDDHAKKVAQRIGLAPQGDYKTGPYGKQ